jgi:HPt (histidine-containing phosphotransfer) domain-containing protein
MTASPVRPGFDPTLLLEIVGDDLAFLDEFVALFHQDVRRLEIQIREALERLDDADLERAAHSLKGMLSHFGETRALELAAQLEDLGSRSELGAAGKLASALIAEVELIRAGLERL